MITVSVFEFRNNLAEYLRMAEQGEEVTVTRFDRPVASMVKTTIKKIKSFKDFRGFLGRGGETGEQYLDRIRRSKPGFEM